MKALRKHAFPVEDTQELMDLRTAGHALLLRTTVREPTPAAGQKHDGRWLGNSDKDKVWPERGMKPGEATDVLAVYRRQIGILKWEGGVNHGLRVLEVKLKGNPTAAKIQAAVESYEALGEAMIDKRTLEDALRRQKGRALIEQHAAVQLREGVGKAATSIEMQALLEKAETSKMVEAEVLDWAAHVIAAKVKEEARLAKLAKAEAERRKKIAEEEAAKKLEEMKKKRKRVLKGKAKSMLQMIGAQKRGTRDRLEEEALMSEHKSALAELEQLKAELAEEAEEEQASVAREEEIRREQLAALQSTLAKAEEEAEAAKKLVTVYSVKLRNVAEPNDKCDAYLNEVILVLHGAENDSPPVTIRKKGLWAAQETSEVKINCPQALGEIGMVSFDDGARGAVAARVLCKVVVMRKKSYDPPWNFSNELAEDHDKPIDRSAGVLQLTKDLPTLREIGAESAKEEEESTPELEPEPEPEPAVEPAA